MGQRANTQRYAGPERFTAFDDGGSFFKIEESAAPELYALAQKFPKAFTRALLSVGAVIRVQLKSAISNGGPSGVSWAQRSKMHIYRRMDLLRAGQVDKEGQWAHGKRFYLKKRIGHARVSGKERMMERWRGRGITRQRDSMLGRLVNAMRYKMVNASRVDIGAVTPSATAHLAAVQSGRRGSRGVFQFTGTQPVTPAMRRAFWAAGVPLAKSTTMLKQEPRPLVAPVYKEVSPGIVDHIVKKMHSYLEMRQGSLI